MADASSSSSGSGSSGIPGLGDVFAMFGGSSLFNGVGKTIEQFKRGVTDFLVAVETFNETMQTLNGVATRVSALLDDIEEPVRAFMPQMTRSIKAADTMINQISGPIEKVAPGLSRLAETLSSPVFASMPDDIARFLETIGDVARRLQPLSLMAESASSMFGLRSLGDALRGGGRPTPDRAPAAPAPVAAAKQASRPSKPVTPKPVAPKPVTPKRATPKRAAPKRAAPKR